MIIANPIYDIIFKYLLEDDTHKIDYNLETTDPLLKRMLDRRWQRFFPDAEWPNYNGIDAEATPDSGVVMAYTTLKSHFWYAIVDKFDKNGQLEWRTQFPGKSNKGNVINLAVLPQGGYVCNWRVNTWPSFTLYAYPDLIFKLGADGDLEWAKGDSTHARALYEIFTTPKNEIIACGVDLQGTFPDTRPSDYVAFARCYSADGDLLWERTTDDYRAGAEWTFFYSGTALPNGDLLFTGTRTDSLYALSAPYVDDAWVVKTDNMGCLKPGCGFEQGITAVREPQRRTAFKAFTVFPMPTDGTCTLMAVLGAPLPKGRYEALLYDPLGRLLERRPFDPNLPEDFDLRAGPSGTYLLSVLREGATVQVIKVMKE